MKLFIKKIISFLAKKISSFGFKEDMNNHYYRMRLYFLDRIIESLFGRVRKIKVIDQEILFTVPNYISDWRAQTSSFKEPDTIDWINNFNSKKVFWDIGANVGVFSLYAAKARSTKVLAFEPSIFNLELLARNININNLQDLISVVPIPLSNQSEISSLNFSTETWGGALSTFKEDFGWDGKPFDPKFSLNMFGSSLDDMVYSMKLTPPNYLKIDVDGLEHLILEGGQNTLEYVESILIEVNASFADQYKTIERILSNNGFKLDNEKISEFEPDNTIDGKNNLASSVYNQIWSR